MEIADPPTDPVRSSRILESFVVLEEGDDRSLRTKIPRLSIFIDSFEKKRSGVTITGGRWTREIGGKVGKRKGCNARGVFNELEDTGKGWELA